MLPKKFQLNLRKHLDFFKIAARRQTPLFIVYQHTLGEDNGVAIVVSKATAPLASARNNLKRRVGRVLGTSLQNIPLQHSVVLVVKKQLLTASDQQIETDINRIFGLR